MEQRDVNNQVHHFENFVEDYDCQCKNGEYEVVLKTIDIALFFFLLLVIGIAFIYP